MLKRISSFVLVCSCMLIVFNSTANAQRYVVRAYHAPVVVAQPTVVAAPVYPVQVVPRRVVRVGYYTPAPIVVTPTPVVVTPTVVAPTPVVVSPRRRVHQVVRGTGNRSVVVSREYRPLGIFPTGKHKVIERDTRHGVIVRERGR